MTSTFNESYLLYFSITFGHREHKLESLPLYCDTFSILDIN